MEPNQTSSEEGKDKATRPYQHMRLTRSSDMYLHCGTKCVQKSSFSTDFF